MIETQKERLRILIIDNHAELVKQIETRLSYEEDFDVCMVAPLCKLTESILHCKPDLLLMELIPSLTVVVLTAVVDTAMQIRLKKEGVHCILEKGISSNELVESLRRVITLPSNEA